MSDLLHTGERDGVSWLTMDDGKANVLSFAMFEAINAALDDAESNGQVVVLAGRPGRFSGGFDLAVLTSLTVDAARLLRTGFELSHRLLSFPRPVVVACTGHAYAMGSFLVLSGDYRLGAADAEHRLTANEVSIGMTLPYAAIEVLRQRLTRAAFERAALQAEVFDPVSAVAAGWLDARHVGSLYCKRGYFTAKRMAWRKHAKEAQHVDARRRHERGEPAQKCHGRQHHVGLAGVARSAKFAGDLAAGCLC